MLSAGQYRSTEEGCPDCKIARNGPLKIVFLQRKAGCTQKHSLTGLVSLNKKRSTTGEMPQYFRSSSKEGEE